MAPVESRKSVYLRCSTQKASKFLILDGKLEISGIPDEVDHKKLIELLRELGFSEINDLEKIVFGHNGVKVTLWPKNVGGHHYVGYDGENIASHEVNIPYMDAKPPISDEILRY